MTVNSTVKIPKGFILKARIISESEIAHKSPVVREVWDWLLMNANHKEAKKGGGIIKRGQQIRTISEINNGLAWYIGYRKMTYSEKQTKDALKVLRKCSMIVTTKVCHGMLISICNYDKYQNSKNYEGAYEGTIESTPKVPRESEGGPDNNKNGKNGKNGIDKALEDFNISMVADFIADNKLDEKKIENAIPEFKDYWRGQKKKRSDWSGTFKNFCRNEDFGGLKRFKSGGYPWVQN